MTQDELRRIREFVVTVHQVMACIPLPMPPDVRATWGGALFDSTALHQAYNRLPAAHQDAFALVFRLCGQVIENQSENARVALMARMQTLADAIIQTGMTSSEFLGTQASARPSHLALVTDDFAGQEKPAEDMDAARELELLLQPALRPHIEAYLRSQACDDDAEPAQAAAAPASAPPPSNAPRVLWGRVTAGAALAVAAMFALLWLDMRPPSRTAERSPAPITIERTVEHDGVTLMISHSEEDPRTGDTRIHAHLCNTSDRAQPAALGVGDTDAPAEATLVPARSIRHQVLTVPRGQEKTLRIRLGKHTESVELR